MTANSRYCQVINSVGNFFRLVSLSPAVPHPQVEMVKKMMPAVVGIGIEKSGYESYRFSGSGFMEEFKKFYQKEEDEFQKKSKPQWDKEKDKITPADVIGIGSGFIVDRSGKVITNYHVIEDRSGYSSSRRKTRYTKPGLSMIRERMIWPFLRSKVARRTSHM